jgi:hypothetical protein
MTVHRCIRVFSLAALLLIVPAGVFPQDVDAMAKWTALTIVHYRVVGEYAAEAPLLAGTTPSKAQATDRVDIEFDWDQFEMKMAGEAKVTNSPTTFTPLAVGPCPPARPSGALEIATALSVENAAAPGMINVALKTDTPAGAAPTASDDGPCGSAWTDVAASSTTKDQMLQIMPAMMLAMGPNPSMVTPDGKSLFVKAAGWTWTFTPTAVR